MELLDALTLLAQAAAPVTGTGSAVAPATPTTGAPGLPTDVRGMMPYLLSGLGLMMFFMMVRSARRKVREDDPTADPLAAIAAMRARAVAREDVQDQIDEVKALLDRLSRDLSAKSAHLEELLERADRHIAALKADPTAPAGTPPAPIRDKPASTLEPAPGVDRLIDDVYRLADQGLRGREIADELRVSPAQVELVLALRTA